MMFKKYFNTFLKTFFFTSIVFILVSMVIVHRTDYQMPFIKLTIGMIVFSLIVSLAIRVFKSEKGKPYINAILGYLIVIPSLFIVRFLFSTYVFTRVYFLYILIGIIGVIYGVALLVASRKYKSEVDELNRLLMDKQNKDIETDEEED